MQGTYTMARNNNAATAAATRAPVATPTTAALRAGNAHKYAAATPAGALPGKALPNANVRYTLTPLGAKVAAAGGVGTSGKVTVMGAVAVAAATLVAKGRPLTGANIAAAMQALPAMRSAIASSRAAAKYAAGGHYCNAWLGGYIAGAARKAHGLLAVATA